MSQRQSPMYCKIITDVKKTIADVLQDLYRGHKDNCHKSTNENAVPVTKYCKILTDVRKTIADVLQDPNRHHKELIDAMYCKVFTDVTKTIADVLQDPTDVTKTIADVLQGLYRYHKDNRRCIA